MNFWFKGKPPEQVLFNDSGIKKSYSHNAELDLESGTWRYIGSWALDNIDKLRKANDSPLKGDLETARIRGKIEALKELLDIEQKIKSGFDDTDVDTEDDPYLGN